MVDNLFISRSASQVDQVLTALYWRGIMVHWSIEAPSMALDSVPASAGMTYPCRDNGIVEFGFDLQIEA